KDDVHKARYGEKCASCHSEKDWRALLFDHNRDTRYPLRGKHASVKCDSCHTGNLYRDKLASTCVACHRKDDKHKGQEGNKCESCHSERTWKDMRLDQGLTRFPLLGAPVKVECKQCHPTAAFKDASTPCVACTRRTTSTSGNSDRNASNAITRARGKRGTSITTGARISSSTAATADCIARHAISDRCPRKFP